MIKRMLLAPGCTWLLCFASAVWARVIPPQDVVQDSIQLIQFSTNSFAVRWQYTEAGSKRALAEWEADGAHYGMTEDWKQGWLKSRTDKEFFRTRAAAEAWASSLKQFIDLTVEIQLDDWDYQFFYDRTRKQSANLDGPSIFTKSQTRRCIIGADTWMIESVLPAFDETLWFTGSNLLASTVITQKTPDEVIKKIAERTKFAVGVPPVGHRSTRVYESVDGNPGRPGGVADVTGFNLPARISWFAFCSAATLKHKGRRIFPPSDMWKESSIYYSGWSDSTEIFSDGLRLPRSVDLISTNGQPIFQYQVRQSTNILGWHVPLEFYGVQYLPTRTNGWKVHLTFKGRVTSIAPASKPEIPPSVMTAIEK